MTTEINIELDKKSKGDENKIIFDIKGNNETGLDKSIINGLRRVLLASIPTVAFSTRLDNSDLTIKKNDSPLHNEFLQDRIGLIPLYINPLDYQKQYLFRLQVENNSSEPVTTITANDFDIYPLKKDVDSAKLETFDINDYDHENKLSQKEKAEIFRPFNFRGKKEYCIITELKSSSPSTKQSIDLYGVPSVSYAYEDAKWQAVSCATYSFKRDEQLFQKILEEKIKLNNIAKSNQAKFKKELWISESERYFHRDKNLEPYWYSFKLDSVHFMKSKELFMYANELMIEALEKMIQEFPKLSSGDKSILSLKEKEDGIFDIIVNGIDDTIGNLLQSNISKKIDDKSILSICGYKRRHPLEEIVVFTISLNQNNKVFHLNKPQQIVSIIELFIESCNDLIQVFSLIKKEADEKL